MSKVNNTQSFFERSIQEAVVNKASEQVNIPATEQDYQESVKFLHEEYTNQLNEEIEKVSLRHRVAESVKSAVKGFFSKVRSVKSKVFQGRVRKAMMNLLVKASVILPGKLNANVTFTAMVISEDGWFTGFRYVLRGSYNLTRGVLTFVVKEPVLKVGRGLAEVTRKGGRALLSSYRWWVNPRKYLPSILTIIISIFTNTIVGFLAANAPEIALTAFAVFSVLLFITALHRLYNSLTQPIIEFPTYTERDLGVIVIN